MFKKHKQLADKVSPFIHLASIPRVTEVKKKYFSVRPVFDTGLEKSKRL